MTTLNPGQGQPVPPSVGEGVWLAEGMAYWDTTDTSTDLPDSSGELIAMLAPSDRPQPIALSASRYAATLHVTVSELLEANAAGELEVTSERVQGHEGTGDQDGLRVTVALGTRVAAMTFERPDLS